MTDKREKVFEEPEIVGQGAGPRRSRGPARGPHQDTNRQQEFFENMARDGFRQAKSQLFWTSFFTIFGFILVGIVLIAAFIALLIWLLPFIWAALIITIFLILGVAIFRQIQALFGKK